MKRYFYIFLALLYSGLIYYLSDQPKPLREFDYILRFDKLLHCLEYFIFAFVWWLVLRMYKSFQPFLFRTIFFWGALYAASDEIHQSFVPGRFSSIWDWFADIIGIGIFLILVNKLNKKSDEYEKN